MRVNVGLNVERTDFIAGASASDEVRRFRDEHGGQFTTVLVTGSWANDKRDSRFLPSTGSLTRLSSEVAVPGGGLTYYKVSAQHQRFFPLPADFVLALDGEAGYGDGFGGTRDLPLTDNFFAGRRPALGARLQDQYPRAAGFEE